MPNLGPFSNESKLDSLAYDMFKDFSRMEYSLKAIKYFKSFKNGARAEADWDRFADSIDDKIRDKISNNKELAAAVSFLLGEPPKQQVIENGIIAWANVKPNTQTQTSLLLQYVRRVRNNLFHGGKFNGN